MALIRFVRDPGLGPFAHLDANGLNILQTRLAYLFPTRRSVGEWVAMGIRAAVLVVGVGYSKNELVRRLCIATLITLALGMLFAIVASDWLHVIVAAQMQTWRWLWLLGVLSVLLAPSIAIDCWRSGGLGRAAVVLLLSAWLTRPDAFAILPMVLACVAAAMPAAVRDPTHKRSSIQIGRWHPARRQPHHPGGRGPRYAAATGCDSRRASTLPGSYRGSPGTGLWRDCCRRLLLVLVWSAGTGMPRVAARYCSPGSAPYCCFRYLPSWGADLDPCPLPRKIGTRPSRPGAQRYQESAEILLAGPAARDLV